MYEVICLNLVYYVHMKRSNDYDSNIGTGSLRAQTVLCGFVALVINTTTCGGVDNDVPQLHAMLSEPLD